MKKNVITSIMTNAILVPIVRKIKSIDHAETLSHWAYMPSVGHFKIRAKSPFDILFWEQNLRSHPDPIFVQTILDGIRFGVKIGYGPQMSLEWPLSLEHFDKVSETIRKNVVWSCRRAYPLPPPLKFSL